MELLGGAGRALGILQDLGAGGRAQVHALPGGGCRWSQWM